jgi:DNA-binding NarL/FixJ family response regulator
LFRDGVRGTVERTAGLRWLGAGDDPCEAFALCTRLRPDVLLVDSTLDPRGRLAQVVIDSDRVRSVIALVSRADQTSRYLAEAMRQGTHGFVERSVDSAKLATAIRTCHTGGRYVAPNLRPLVAHPETMKRMKRGEQHLISGREYQVLYLLGNGIETKEIAQLLFVSPETVRTHSKSLLRKLGARNRAHAITIAHHLGILGGSPAANPREPVPNPPSNAAGIGPHSVAASPPSGLHS